MKIQITARHYHASRTLHQNLVENAERLARFNGSLASVHYILDAGQSGTFRAEAVVKVRDRAVVARAEEGTMGKAIEMMREKLERQLKKENEKLKTHQGEPLVAALV